MSPKSTHVQHTTNGQFRVTIPRGKGNALELAGADAVWRVRSADSLRLTVVSRGDSSPQDVRTTRIQRRGDNGQYIVTIAPGLAEAMRLRDAEVSWHDYSRDSLDVRVESRGGNQ